MPVPQSAVELALSLTMTQLVGAGMIVAALLLSVLVLFWSMLLIVERFYPSILQPDHRSNLQRRYNSRTGKPYYISKGRGR